MQNIHSQEFFKPKEKSTPFYDILRMVGPGGQAVPTQVQTLGNGQFKAEFVPRVVGEHRINVSVNGVPTTGSPYAAKVYDVQAIKVKEVSTGIVGKPVTFLGKFL